jgi:PAS domain S-box-containing protein
VCAVAFTWLAADITLRLRSLHGTPVALNFGVVAAIAMLFGLGPGIASVLLTAIVFYYRFLLPGSASAFALGSIVRTIIILAVGLLIVLLCNRQRSIWLRLRAALASLREHADTLAQAQQGSRSAAWVFNSGNGAIHWAPGGAELLGRPFEEITRLDSLIGLAFADDRPAVERAVEQTRKAGTLFHVEFRVPLPGGELRWLELRGAPSPADQTQWRGVVLDVTDRKNAEIALIRSEKLAAIGRLSATVAHEINNPLEAVTNLLYLASGVPDLPTDARIYLLHADQELQRLASIARHTLTFAKVKPPEGPVEITAIAQSVVAMFQTRGDSLGGRVRLLYSAELDVDAPADELRQILTNLVSNACDASRKPDGLVELYLFAERERAVLIVRDNGSGIAAEDSARIFDAFFTTKNDVGTGIGLWITKELVEKNNGAVSVESGAHLAPFATSFRVELPLAKRSV